MPSSYRVIKNYQVDMGLDEFKVPIVPAHHLIKTGEEPSRKMEKGMKLGT